MSEKKLPPDLVKVPIETSGGVVARTEPAVISMSKFEPIIELVSKFNLKPIPSFSCPICGDAAAKQMIVHIIVVFLQEDGSFSVGSVKNFWNKFGFKMCNHCRSKLDYVDETKGQALKLLEEAVCLDKSNSSAKENLSALKRLL
ncbi:MAG: hypothetical protein J7K35_06575 [Syntrophobacterales bacterium]|nr:hypothetical protein [Syntrophobacterales bacterium]